MTSQPATLVLTAAAMLEDLKTAHEQVRVCIDDMEAVTSACEPDRLQYTKARFNISKASMARRTCFHSICDEISNSASPSELEAIMLLRGEDRLLLGKSAAHVTRWTADTIEADWRGYRTASRSIRREMADQLDREVQFLFPLLEGRGAEFKGRARAA